MRGSQDFSHTNGKIGSSRMLLINCVTPQSSRWVVLRFHIANVPSQIILQASGTQRTEGSTRIPHCLTGIHELKEGAFCSQAYPPLFCFFFFSQEKNIIRREIVLLAGKCPFCFRRENVTWWKTSFLFYLVMSY